MDRSNTRNMRGGKARFVQRNHTHFPKSPRVKKGHSLVPKLRLVGDAPGRRMLSPKLGYAQGNKKNPTEVAHVAASNSDVAPSECQAPSEEDTNPQRPWCRCLFIMPGFEFYYLCYEAEDGVICAPVLTGKGGRILYCTDSAKIPRMLMIGREDLAALGEPDLGEMDFISIPEALDECRKNVQCNQAKSMNDVFDALTELLAACDCPEDDSILSYLLSGFSNWLTTPVLTWEELAAQRGYRGLSVEEGIQLALGIVLTNGRHVA